MTKVNDLLTDRLKKKDHDTAKMLALAERSSTGQLSGFAGIFQVAKLSSEEQEKIRKILSENSEDNKEQIDKDFFDLVAITSEVKAINSQAIILHGERIKKAQTVLKKYKEGAFTQWLIHTYGNRQTPYNFLQYYEFYSKLNAELKEIALEMPKQAIYTLASREGSIDQKIAIVKNYTGESKMEMLKKIRKTFPLFETDKRGGIPSQRILRGLQSLINDFSDSTIPFSKEEKKTALKLIKELKDLISQITDADIPQ
jgi:Ca2+-binding EF-hand superfamily protein